jgi:hypothetical protein
MKTYTITAKGKEFAKTARPETHAGAVLLAVSKLNKGKGGTSAEIIARVKADKKIRTKMNLSNAVSFMLFDLGKRRGLLAAK